MESELLIPVMLTDLPGAVMKTCSCLEEQAALSCVFGWEFIPGELVWRQMCGPAGVKGLVPCAERCMFSCMWWLFEAITGLVLSFPQGPFFHDIWYFPKAPALRQRGWKSAMVAGKRCRFFRFIFLGYLFKHSSFTELIADVHRGILAGKHSTSMPVFYCWWDYY